LRLQQGSGLTFLVWSILMLKNVCGRLAGRCREAGIIETYNKMP
jgi:hypothetical protein